ATSLLVSCAKGGGLPPGRGVRHRRINPRPFARYFSISSQTVFLLAVRFSAPRPPPINAHAVCAFFRLCPSPPPPSQRAHGGFVRLFEPPLPAGGRARMVADRACEPHLQ